MNCLKCGTTIINKRNKFCNSSCAASYNNTRYHKRGPEGVCQVCSAPISKHLKYCSTQCRSIVSNTRKRIRAKRAGKFVASFRRRVKKQAVDILGGCCCFCGYSRCIASLQFHHVNPREKDFTISGVSLKIERILKEIKKCILVCSNCHGEIHAGLITQEQINEKFNSGDTERLLYPAVNRTPQGQVGSTPTT